MASVAVGKALTHVDLSDPVSKERYIVHFRSNTRTIDRHPVPSTSPPCITPSATGPSYLNGTGLPIFMTRPRR
jgi:hypothetical protein